MALQSGMTLVGLVTTIIIIAIFVDVSIAAITGQNGIITKAYNAVKSYTVSAEQENLESTYYMAVLEAKFNNEKVTKEYLETELKGSNANVKITPSPDNPDVYNILFIDSANEYCINISNGETEYLGTYGTGYEEIEFETQDIVMKNNQDLWVHEDIVTTIEFADRLKDQMNNYTLEWKRTGSENWQKYEEPIISEQNETIYARISNNVNGNIEVTRNLSISKIDKIDPTVVFEKDGGKSVANTENGLATIKTTVTVSDEGGSGICEESLKYVWSERQNEEPASGWTEFTNNEEIVKNDCEPSKTYYLWIQYNDNARNNSETGILRKVTNPFIIVSSDQAKIEFETTWDETKPNTATVQITGGYDGAQLQYQVGGIDGEWKDGNSVTVTGGLASDTTEKTMVYARLYDGVNTSLSSTQVKDRTLPNIEDITKNTEDWKRSLELTAKATDEESLVTKWDWKENADTERTPARDSENQTKTIDENGTYYFSAEDGAGNKNVKSIKIENIDTVDPTVTFGKNGGNYIVDSKKGASTVKTTITVSDEGGSGVFAESLKYAWNQSKTDAPTSGWTEFTNQVEVIKEDCEEGKTYYLWVEYNDNARNNSGEETVKSVSNGFVIGTEEQTNIEFKTTWSDTEANVATVELIGSYEGSELQYQLGGIDGEWLTGTAIIVNGGLATEQEKTMVYARLYDGINTRLLSIQVKDRTAPEVTNITKDTEEWAKIVTLTSQATDEESLVTKWDWKDVATTERTPTEDTENQTLEVTKNGTYYFSSEDGAGNTNVKSIEIENIDNVAPIASFGTNGGNYIKPTDSNATIKTTVTVTDEGGSGVCNESLKYAWSQMKTEAPIEGWLEFTNGAEIVKNDCEDGKTYYLWIACNDNAGNNSKVETVKYASNAFIVGTQTIKFEVSDSDKWLNGDKTVTISYGDNLTENKKAGFGKTLTDAINAASSSTIESVTATENGYVYAEQIDSNGNKAYASVQVTMIDKIAPTASFGADSGIYSVNPDGSGIIKSTVTVSDEGGSEPCQESLKYVWSSQNQTVPTTGWVVFTNGEEITKLDVDTAGTWYLWIEYNDNARNNSGTTALQKVSNIFTINNATLERQITPSNYGDKVNYSANGITDWKVFYNDGENVFIIPSDYVPLTALSSSISKAGLGTSGTYGVTGSTLPSTVQAGWDTNKSKYMMEYYNSEWNTNSTNSFRITASLLNSANWTEFVDTTYADWAIGSPTLEMWVASWNSKGYTKLYCNSTSSGGYYLGTYDTPTSTSVNLSNDMVGYGDKLYYPNNESYNNGYWIASPAGAGSDYLHTVNISGGIILSYRYTNSALRPIVMLKTGIKATSSTSNGVTTWNLNSDISENNGTELIPAITMSVENADVWTNTDKKVTISYNSKLTQNKKAGFGKTLAEAVTASSTATSESVIATENGYVYAEATDINGNKAYATIQITNIDKTPPIAVFKTNGGTYSLNPKGTGVVSTVVNISDVGTGLYVPSLKYVWGTSNTQAPTSGWTEFTSGDTIYKRGIDSVGIWYLWIECNDIIGQNTGTEPVKIVSNGFEIKQPQTLAQQITAANYGDKINYSVTIGATTVSDWKIFYSDGENVFIIPSDYVPVETIPSVQGISEVSTSTMYNMCWPYTAQLYTGWDTYKSKYLMTHYNSNWSGKRGFQNVSAMLMTDNWTKFVDTTYADWAIGSPTLEMWIASWNAKGYGKLYCNSTNEYGYFVGRSSTSAGTSIGVSSNDSLYFPHTEPYENCNGYWLASTGTNGDHYIFTAQYNLTLSSQNAYMSYALRPIVMLKKDVLAGSSISNGITTWKLGNTDNTALGYSVAIQVSDAAKWTSSKNVSLSCYVNEDLISSKKLGYGTTLEEAKAAATTYTSSIAVTQNGYAYAEITDLEGNKYYTSIQITKIDDEIDYIANKVVPANYGDKVNYSVTINGETIDEWKIFYNDGDNVFIIPLLCVPSTTLPTISGMANNGNGTVCWPTEIAIKENWSYKKEKYIMKYYNSTWEDNENKNFKIVSNLLTTSWWTNFVDTTYADWAIGAPTLEMWVSSWNAKGYSKLYCNNTNEYGYYIGSSSSPTTTNKKISTAYTGYKDMTYFTTSSYWLAAPGIKDASSSLESDFFVYSVKNTGNITGEYSYSSAALRPVVMLKSTTKAIRDENNVLNLSY